MASERRIERLNKTIAHLIAEILSRYFSFGVNAMITVTKVEVHTNMSKAEVYFTTLPESEDEKFLLFLRDNIFDIQQVFNKSLHIRPVPKLVFKIDKGQEEAEKIYSLLEKAKKGKKKK